MPPAASIAPQSANGSAKIECSHLIISSVTRACLRSGTEYCIEARFSVAFDADQRHESEALENFYADFPILLAHQLKFLRLRRSDWNHHLSVFGELFEQTLRDLRRGGRN